MARLQKYKSLIGFDVLEKFYGETINGAYVLIENFERSFCNKCGKVTATQNDMCDCGATKFMRLPQLDYWSMREGILKSKISTSYDASTDTYTISAELLKLKSSNRDDYEVYIENKDIISFGHNTYTLHEKDLLRNVSTEHMQGYKYKEELLNYVCLFNYRCTPEEQLTAQMAINVIDGISTCPEFILDPDTMRFKYLANCYVKNFRLGSGCNHSFRDVITAKGAHPEHFEILDKFCKDSNSYYSSDYEVLKGLSTSYWRSAKDTFSNFLATQAKLYSKKPGHIWDTLYHHLLSGAISLGDFCVILNHYNVLFDYDEKTFRSAGKMDWFYYGHPLRNTDDFCDFWKKDYIKLFPTYLKENLYGKETSRLVVSFVDDLYLMKTHSIPIEEESLKLKNFNYNLNERNLSEYLGLAPEKVEVFLDTFDRNPLASVSLLKDRRKLTKKQMDEYLELLDKDI